MKDLQNLQFEIILAVIAIVGGVARYLNSYTKGVPFSLGMFLASVFASGFSGLIFGLIGISTGLPDTLIFIMAGTGGFFADQAMKYALEFVTKKTK